MTEILKMLATLALFLARMAEHLSWYTLAAWLVKKATAIKE